MTPGLSLVRPLLAAASAALAVAASAAEAPRAKADPDAMGEVRRASGGPFASARAIGHYLTARRKATAGDLVGATEELRLAVAYDDASAELRAAYAEALALTGHVEAAEAEARRALERSTEGRPASTSWLLLARIHAARQERAEAQKDLAAAMAIEATPLPEGERPDPEPWRLAAEQDIEAGDADGALQVLDDAMHRIGTDGGGFREVGRGLLERGDLPRAERALRAAVDRARHDEEAWRLLAEVHRAQRRPADAHQDLLEVLRSDPDDPEALLALGHLALQDDDLTAAREWLARFLRAASERQEPHLRVAFEWLEARRPEEALAVAREGLDQDSPGPRLLLAQGLALEALRRFDEAATSFGQVPVGSGETWFAARGAQASVLSRAGHHAQAVAALEPALAARPGDPRLVVVQAELLWRAGRAAEAVVPLEAVVADRERTHDEAALTELYPALADALVRAGRAGEAVSTLEQAALARPRDPAVLYALGAAYERAGRSDEAVTQMQALVALQPDHAEALNFIGYTWAERGQRLEEAEALVRRALALSPRSGHMIDSLGYIRLRRGAPEEAIRLLEEADRISGPDPAILEHLGDAYRSVSRPADAAAAWRRGLKSVGEDPPAEQVTQRATLERKLKELGAAAERRPVAR